MHGLGPCGLSAVVNNSHQRDAKGDPSLLAWAGRISWPALTFLPGKRLV